MNTNIDKINEFDEFVDILEMIFDLQKYHSNDEIVVAIRKMSDVSILSSVTLNELISFMWANIFLKLK